MASPCISFLGCMVAISGVQGFENKQSRRQSWAIGVGGFT